MRYVEVGLGGVPAEPVPESKHVRWVCEAAARLYASAGYDRPWGCYLAVDGDQTVGTCAFKTPPRAGRVEIAYFTFPEFEGRGIATSMARWLVATARDAAPEVTIVAQTLPEQNASTAILGKLGFARCGVAHDPEAGEVWEWELVGADRSEGEQPKSTAY